MQGWLSFVHNQFVTEQRILFNCPWQLTVIIFLCLWFLRSPSCNRWSHGVDPSFILFSYSRTCSIRDWLWATAASYATVGSPTVSGRGLNPHLCNDPSCCSWILFFLWFFKVLLKYSWFTRLWSFLLYNKVIPSSIYTNPFSFRFFPHTEDHLCYRAGPHWPAIPYASVCVCQA